MLINLNNTEITNYITFNVKVLKIWQQVFINLNETTGPLFGHKTIFDK